MPKFEKGFTLIELLVVISIMGILSVTSYVYWRSLSSDRVVMKAIDNIQTLVKTAQSNATSGFSCDNVAGATRWSIRFNFANKNIIDLICNKVVGSTVTNIFPRSVVLDNAKVDAIELVGANCSVTITSGTFEEICNQITSPADFVSDITVSYSPLIGKIQITGSGESQSCLNNFSSLRIKVKNTNNDASKCFFISNGGAINAQ